MEKTVIKIDRSKWRTGGVGSSSTGEGPTHLLNDDGYMCCLGFVCEQGAGLHEDEILNKIGPSRLDGTVLGLTEIDENGNIDNTDCCSNAMRTNDQEEGITQDEREERIIEIFKYSPYYDITFEGNYADSV